MQSSRNMFYIFFLLVVISVSVSTGKRHDGNYETENIYTDCNENKTEKVDDQKKVNLRASWGPVPCNTTVNLTTKNPDDRLLVGFTYMDCTNKDAKLYIIGKRVFSCSYYSSLPTVSSTGNYLTIVYYNGNYPKNGSTTTYLAFYYNKLEQCSYADDDEFRCLSKNQNGPLCIDKVLTCDEKCNCHDCSDESYYTCGMSQGAEIAVAVTSTIISVSIIVCVVAVCISSAVKRKKKSDARVRMHSGTPVGPTTTASQSQDTTTYSNETGDFLILAPPAYSEGAPYVNIVMVPGAQDTEPSTSAPYDTVPPPKYDEIPKH